MSSEQDFDFLVGGWNVAHSRLNGRLVGSNDWQDFAGACSMRKLMGGFGNVDENILHLPDGAYQAVALRSFNSETRQWAIWWLDGRSPHTLDAPVIGAFADGVPLRAAAIPPTKGSISPGCTFSRSGFRNSTFPLP